MMAFGYGGIVGLLILAGDVWALGPRDRKA